MPAIFNISAHLALGSGLALSARGSETFRQDVVSWPMMLLFAFHAVIAAPSATYLFRFYPQWSMLYAFDPQVFPQLESWIGPLSAGVVLLNLVVAMLGLLTTRAGLLSGSPLVQQLPLAISALAFIAGLIFYGERALWVGTYDAYWDDQASIVFATGPGIAGLLTYALGVGFVVWVRRRFGEREPSYI